jgi:hypothetical protein
VDPKQSETQTQEIPAAVKFETNANSAIIVVAVGVSIIALISCLLPQVALHEGQLRELVEISN